MLRSKSAASPPTRPTRLAVILQRILQALLLVVVGGVIYRYCWTDDIADPLKCGALLNKGEWLDPGPRRGSRNRFRNWQPPGCILHEYNRDDIPECFQQRRLVFAGDSTVRQIFWAVAKKMDLRNAERNITAMFTFDQMSEDLEFSAHGVTVQYIWDPYLNSTRLRQELRRFRAVPTSPLMGTDGDVDPDASAASILLGAPGLWYARHGQDNYFKEFRDSVDAVVPYMDHSVAEMGTPATPDSYRARRESPNLLLFAPVQEPRYQNLSPSREATITPEKIDQMNDYLQQVSAHSKADVIWSYSLMTLAARGTYEESGLHVIENVALRKADVLLNLKCNSDAASQGRRLKGTCCMNYTKTAVPEWLIVIAGMLVLPVLTCLRRKRVAGSTSRLPAAEVIEAMAIMGLILCFCFYADRTQIFVKAHKKFNGRRLLMTYIAAAVGGLLSAKRNKPQPLEHKGNIAFPDDDRYLPRQQTDEWKGWMQVIILMLHFSHDSEKLWEYQTTRLLVSTYLFLTGYGHTIYFLESNDYSLRRVATVLIRLNLLSCFLPYLMRIESAFYSYIPLVTFWSLIVYTTLQYRREENSEVEFLIEKILVSALFTTAFTLIPGFLELSGFALKYSCGISWDMGVWRARLYLDMYIVFVGMLTAVLMNQARQLKAGQTAPTSLIDTILQLIFRSPRLWKAAIITPSLILPPVLWTITRRSPHEEDYNWWHPYISCIPILSFIALRNAHRILRERHLSLFAWLGRQSLEMYVLHHHIWLAGDAQGLLRLGLWSGSVETAILTPVFLWVSGGAANATRVLTAWIVNGPAEDVCLGDARSFAEIEGATGKSQPRVWSDLRWRLMVIVLVLWVGGLLRGVYT